MRSPRKMASLLDRRLEAWRSVLVANGTHDHGRGERNRLVPPIPRSWSVSDELPRMLDYALPRSFDQQEPANLEYRWNQEIDLSANYVVKCGDAIREALTARGQLLDLLEMIDQSWPNQMAWCERKRKKSVTSRILGGTLRSESLQRELVLGDLAQLSEESTSEQTKYEDTIPQLDVLYAYRDAKARLVALRELDAISIREESVDMLAYDVSRRTPIPDREALAWMAKEYIFNECLYLWEDDGLSKSRKQRYKLVFELANLSEATLSAAVVNALQHAVENADLEASDLEETLRIVRRIAFFVHVFGYEHFLMEVTQDGGQWGPVSGIGSQEAINLVPGGKPGACRRILVGLASGRNSRAKGSLQNVLASVLKHMQQRVEVTKIAIVITDTWDKEILVASLDGVLAYKRQGKKFIVLLVNGRRLVPMDFSFL
jgi:hypothetical protein